jgi:hypothetical protein
LRQGAGDVTDLHARAKAVALASHLGLPLIKHTKLVEALVTGSPLPGGGTMASMPPTPPTPLVADKFQAQTLIMGHPSVAARGLNKALGITSNKELSELLSNGEQAIVDEFEAHGSADDKANLEYVLHGVACQEPLPDHIRTQINEGKYHGGSLAKDEFDSGHRGMRFEDFMAHPHCRKADLERPHVLALRVYTSSSYERYISPLRSGIIPHPSKMTVYYLNEAIKLLRAVAAEDDPEYREEVKGCSTISLPLCNAAQRTYNCCPHLRRRGLDWDTYARVIQLCKTAHLTPKVSPCQLIRNVFSVTQVSLWRGMRDMTIMDSFLEHGGTEMAPMSTSRERSVAWKYAASVTPLIFHFKVCGWRSCRTA